MIVTSALEHPGDEGDPLAQFGVSVEILHGALRAGERERRTCTKFDAKSAPGFLMWTRTTRRLREQLTPAPRSWRAIDLNQLPMVINADRSIGIVVSSGDVFTGLHVPGQPPKTRYPKGAMTAAVVERNEQLALFDVPDEPESDAPKPGEYDALVTWVLLWYRDARKREIRGELSRPEKVGDNGKIDQWGDRILLPPIPLGGEVKIEEGDEPDDVDVDVTALE